MVFRYTNTDGIIIYDGFTGYKAVFASQSKNNTIMLKKYPLLKWTLLILGVSILLIVSFGFWFKGLLPPKNDTLSSARATELPYLNENVPDPRGKILAVVTSTSTMGDSGQPTGYELTELARAYYVFQANGFEVDVASPLGGTPPVVIDDEDMGVYDFAFLNDSVAQYKTSHTLPIKEVVPEDYRAIYFVGGKGAMFDFPNNKAIQSIVRDYYQSDRVIGAVCHGPAALVNITLDNGHSMLNNKQVSGFTNEEELLLIPEADSVFPFLLQDELIAKGAVFNEGAMYLENVSRDQNLITGQNPWSVWAVAESMISALGYRPKYRKVTDEENAVNVLLMYHEQGVAQAKMLIRSLLQERKVPINRVLIAKHGIIAAMQGQMNRCIELIGLVSFIKEIDV